jgi:hypothetical protein
MAHESGSGYRTIKRKGGSDPAAGILAPGQLGRGRTASWGLLADADRGSIDANQQCKYLAGAAATQQTSSFLLSSDPALELEGN